jgi:poly-gamma-glutamate synthesis protein (capsule biosynthesis protein)
MKLLLCGDTMLGRGVGKAIERNGPGYPLGKIAAFMKDADLCIVNLECAITSSKSIWGGESKAFYFGAPTDAAKALRMAGVDLVNLANNHVLDFGVNGLEDTLRCLDETGIGHAGAGMSIADASRPALIDRGGMKFGMAAFCDHQPDFAAGSNNPGINYLDLFDEKMSLEMFREGLGKMGKVDWPVLSLHWGPNMVHRPSRKFIRLAHGAIEMGYRIVYGHSAHVFHGVELYRGMPIFYSCGDIVDDYYVDREFANDCQLLFELELSEENVQKLVIHPVRIENCRTVWATGERKSFVLKRFASLCSEFGTQVLGDAVSLSRRS